MTWGCQLQIFCSQHKRAWMVSCINQKKFTNFNDDDFDITWQMTWHSQLSIDTPIETFTKPSWQNIIWVINFVDSKDVWWAAWPKKGPMIWPKNYTKEVLPETMLMWRMEMAIGKLGLRTPLRPLFHQKVGIFANYLKLTFCHLFKFSPIFCASILTFNFWQLPWNTSRLNVMEQCSYEQRLIIGKLINSRFLLNKLGCAFKVRILGNSFRTPCIKFIMHDLRESPCLHGVYQSITTLRDISAPADIFFLYSFPIGVIRGVIVNMLKDFNRVSLLVSLKSLCRRVCRAVGLTSGCFSNLQSVDFDELLVEKNTHRHLIIT